MRIVGAVLALASGLACCACRSGQDYLKQADAQFARAKYADAVLLYRKAIQKDPKSSEAYYKLGLTQRALNDNASALNSLLEAVALNPGSEAAQIELGNLYLGDYLASQVKSPAVYGKITAIADRLLMRDPNSYPGLRFRGYLALSDKQLEQAIFYLSRANEIKPLQPDVSLALTQALLSAQRFEEAHKLALNLIQAHKESGPIYEVLYSYQMAAGHSEEAESLLRLQIANNPGRTEPVIELAQHFRAADKNVEAEKLIDDLLKQQPQTATYFQIAAFYQRNRDWGRAENILDAGSQAHPSDRFPLQKVKAKVLALDGKSSAALDLLNSLLAEQPSDADLKKGRAALLIDSNNRTNQQTAVKDLEALLRQSPSDSELLLQLGRAYAGLGDFPNARLQFEALLHKEPGNIDALLAMAELSSHQKLFPRTLTYSERVLSLDPKQRNARLLHATAVVGLQQLDRAREEYRNLIRDEPQFIEARLQYALLAVAQRRYAEAEKLFREVYRPETGDFRALEGLTELYESQNQFDKALELLTAERRRFPASTPILRLRASTAARAGKPDAAVHDYEELVAGSSAIPEDYMQLGNLYQRKHDLKKSIDALQHAQELRPNDWKASASLATVQQEAGLMPEAKRNYERALKLGADDPDLFNNLAYLDAQSKSDLDAALALAQKALARSPKNPGYADTLGFVYLQQKQIASAYQVFHSLSDRYPKEGIYRYHLAFALCAKGDNDAAKRELQSALTLQPSLAAEPDAKEWMQKIRYNER